MKGVCLVVGHRYLTGRSTPPAASGAPSGDKTEVRTGGAGGAVTYGTTRQPTFAAIWLDRWEAAESRRRHSADPGDEGSGLLAAGPMPVGARCATYGLEAAALGAD